MREMGQIILQEANKKIWGGVTKMKWEKVIEVTGLKGVQTQKTSLTL